MGLNPDWDSAPAIQEMPLRSAIPSLRKSSAYLEKDRQIRQVYGLEEDSTLVEGYCFPGGGQAIIQVDVSSDDG